MDGRYYSFKLANVNVFERQVKVWLCWREIERSVSRAWLEQRYLDPRGG